MRVLIATDAWAPQVNGVVRTLTRWRAPQVVSASTSSSCRRMALRHSRCRPIQACAWPFRAAGGSPSASSKRSRTPSISRPKVRSGTRCAPIAAGAAGRSPRATQRAFPNISPPACLSRRAWIYAALRRFHAAATVTMVATPSLMSELRGRGFSNLGMWTRGVDTELFRPDRAIDTGLPRPIFVSPRARRHRKEPRRIPVLGPAGHQGGDRQGAHGAGAETALPTSQISRAA